MFARRWWGARAAVALALLPVAAYVVLTGAAAPAVRAAFMFGLVGLGSVLGRPTHRLSVLAVAVALMLFVDPQWVAQPGFQLSVAAMVVLVSLPSGAGASLTSWQLGWALLPLLWLHFDASSDGSVLANAVAVPIFALWVVPLAIAGWGLLPLVGGVALDPAAMGAGLILDVAQVVASWPEIPRVVWVAGAVLSWVPRVRRSMSESGRAWLPHRGAAALLLVVAVVSWWPASVHPAWTAWSRGRSPEVLAVAPDGTACVRNPVSAAPLWRTRFDAHGVRTLSGVQLSSHASVADPAVLAWLEGIGGRVRNTTRGAPSCSLPSDDLVRRSLDLCRAFSSAPSARLPAGQSLQCWSARLGEWQPAPIHSR
jgi:ComEC/Rec2-related protein